MLPRYWEMLNVVGENWEERRFCRDFLSKSRIQEKSKSSTKTVIFLDKCLNNHDLGGSS
jgi:hypothetical protein